MNSQDNEKEIENAYTGSYRSLSISRKEFKDYFNGLEEKFGEMVCPLCKTTAWGVPPRSDSNDHPAIVTLPLPNSTGMGLWAYPVVCMECGFIVNFATNHVSARIREE